MSFDTQQWYKENTNGEVIISYKGEITSDLITNTLEVVESKLDDTTIKGKIRKRIYNALVESLQNLYHHSSRDITNEENKTKRFGVFIVSMKNDSYYLITGNFVPNDRVQYLKDRINQLNSMNRDELKSLYKLILNNQEFSEKGGGGLGMIDIARKTRSNFDYKFYDLNNDYSFYSLYIKINSN